MKMLWQRKRFLDGSGEACASKRDRLPQATSSEIKWYHLSDGSKQLKKVVTETDV